MTSSNYSFSISPPFHNTSGTAPYLPSTILSPTIRSANYNAILPTFNNQMMSSQLDYPSPSVNIMPSPSPLYSTLSNPLYSNNPYGNSGAGSPFGGYSMPFPSPLQVQSNPALSTPSYLFSPTLSQATLTHAGMPMSARAFSYSQFPRYNSEFLMSPLPINSSLHVAATVPPSPSQGLSNGANSAGTSTESSTAAPSPVEPVSSRVLNSVSPKISATPASFDPPVSNIKAIVSALSTFPVDNLPSKGTCRKCNCKNSRCLKLYCECLAHGDCNCVNCHNNEEHEAERNEAIQGILLRNPYAFRKRESVTETVNAGSNNSGSITEPASDSLSQNGSSNAVIPSKQIVPSINSVVRGCHCRKTMCLKKYCECYQAGVRCGELCSCIDCKNCSQFENDAMPRYTPSLTISTGNTMSAPPVKVQSSSPPSNIPAASVSTSAAEVAAAVTLYSLLPSPFNNSSGSGGIDKKRPFVNGSKLIPASARKIASNSIPEESPEDIQNEGNDEFDEENALKKRKLSDATADDQTVKSESFFNESAPAYENKSIGNSPAQWLSEISKNPALQLAFILHSYSNSLTNSSNTTSAVTPDNDAGNNDKPPT